LKSYATAAIRNVALAGHSGAGKTSLAEAMLFATKAIDRLGSVTDGNTTSDYDPQEVKRLHSISASLLPLQEKDFKINLLDLPGRLDFVGEIKNSMRVCEGIVLVIDATGGVEVGAEFAAEYADELGIKVRAAFVNKMDKDQADFDRALGQLSDAFSTRAVAVTLPVGAAAGFHGVVDLIKMKLVEEKDRKVSVGEIPGEIAEAAKEARAKLVEAAAEGDDELMMKFLDDRPLSDEEVLKGLKGAMAEGRVMPVGCGAATQSIGVAPLVDLIGSCFPNPTEAPGLEAKKEGAEEATRVPVKTDGLPLLFVFKTVSDPYAGNLNFFKVMRGTVKSESTIRNLNKNKTERIAHALSVCGKKNENVDSLPAGDIGSVAKLESTRTGDTLSDDSGDPLFTPTPMPQPVVQMAVAAKSKADEDKVGIGFHRLLDQDPTLNVRRDPEIHQTILSGMGDTHLDVAVAHLKEIAKVEVELTIPKVPYRETITRKAEGQGKFKKQSGGRGQFGDCWIRFEPLPQPEGFEFEWGIVGGVIPTKFQPSVEKGLIESLEKGVLSGSPTVGVKATCYDGSFHAVDSSDIAFKVAASLAFKSIVPKCNPVILEPIYKVKITVPEANMGDIMGDLNGRRGRILGTNANGKKTTIEAHVPLAEMFTYSRELRSMTRGAGYYEMAFDRYERVPGEIQEKIVAASEKEKEGE
jgi:elongation factor G